MAACSCRSKPSAASIWTRRSIDVAGWLVPGALLALVPKCPACLAAYVALATGIGLTLPVAGVLRTSLIVICMILLAAVATRQLRRLYLATRKRT